ncbi:hypothetical protein RHMOL_Rhmol07G0144800 [Rhododendron molle]|uniref:Uncharacterized protein n=1 Tax=Rhododendron molle TaxID=49168 RepID=A0ACC0N0S2_RHOML|nr:hypothetical protein RHMOL_Rhmol07G0144800 [Rhododendron molle]
MHRQQPALPPPPPTATVNGQEHQDCHNGRQPLLLRDRDQSWVGSAAESKFLEIGLDSDAEFEEVRWRKNCENLKILKWLMSLLQVLRENLDARHLQCGQNLINTRIVQGKKGQSVKDVITTILQVSAALVI